MKTAVCLSLLLMLCVTIASAAPSQEPVGGPLPQSNGVGEGNDPPLVDAERLKQVREFFEQELIGIEQQQGPYHLAVAENQLKLGKVYSAQGQHKLAQDALERGLEIYRRNFGLHHPDQIPIVEQLLQTNRAMGKWKTVDDKYEYLYWLYRRQYGSEAPELLPMLSRLISWKVEAINAQLFGNSENLINQARKASRQARLILKKHPELNFETTDISISSN